MSIVGQWDKAHNPGYCLMSLVGHWDKAHKPHYYLMSIVGQWDKAHSLGYCLMSIVGQWDKGHSPQYSSMSDVGQWDKEHSTVPCRLLDSGTKVTAHGTVWCRLWDQKRKTKRKQNKTKKRPVLFDVDCETRKLRFLCQHFCITVDDDRNKWVDINTQWTKRLTSRSDDDKESIINRNINSCHKRVCINSAYNLRLFFQPIRTNKAFIVVVYSSPTLWLLLCLFRCTARSTRKATCLCRVPALHQKKIPFQEIQIQTRQIRFTQHSAYGVARNWHATAK